MTIIFNDSNSSNIESRLRQEGMIRFQRSQARAQVSDLLSQVTGSQQRDLVQFDEVAKRIKARQRFEKGIQNVPLDQIVGSVGRYKDFTRTFLPRNAVNKERWIRVDAEVNGAVGTYPIDLYKIGEVYFVRDGNHRVSVARANGFETIEAYVTEVETDISLEASDFERDQWIIKIERQGFINRTNLDAIRPDHLIDFTEPGRYEILLRHMEVHRYFKGQELARDFSWEEAVASWFDTVYVPVVDEINNRHLLEHFPSRTEADLFLWIAHHRERLSVHYELAPLTPEVAVNTFAQTNSELPIENTVQGLRQGINRLFGGESRPPGMTDEEFAELRRRHDAGELSVGEADAQEE